MGGHNSKKDSPQEQTEKEVDESSAYQFNIHLPRSKHKWQHCCLSVPDAPNFVQQTPTHERAQTDESFGYFALLPSELIIEVLSYLLERKSTAYCKFFVCMVAHR